MPLAADNLQHWMSGASGVKVMSSATFKKPESEVPTFLHETARNEFEKGFFRRLKYPSDPCRER